MTPLFCCIKFRTPLDIVSVLTEHQLYNKAAIIGNSASTTPLHSICASPEVAEMVELIKLIGTKESSITKGKDGKTPLLLAVENPETSREVINAVCEINSDAAMIENRKGRTPFHVAIRSKAPEPVVKSVLKFYPKAVKVVSKGNNSIFHEMCQYETCKALLL
jgi:ankyrin repeat protein